MQFSDFQKQAKETVIFPEYGKLGGILYSTLEINDEAGEVAGKIKKIIRDEGGEITEEGAEKIVSEMGDVLFALATLTDQLGYNLDDVAKGNLKKLRDRAERGKLKGDGDNR